MRLLVFLATTAMVIGGVANADKADIRTCEREFDALVAGGDLPKSADKNGYVNYCSNRRQNATSETNVPTCTQFRSQLAKAEKIFGGVVPRFQFRDWDENPDDLLLDTHAWAIENVRAVSGQLTCIRKNDRFSDIQITLATDGEMTKENAYALGRLVVAMNALTWAYTNWPKSKVQTVVSSLMKRALREAEKSEFRGDSITLGSASYNLGGNVDITYSVGSGLTFMIDASAAD